MPAQGMRVTHFIPGRIRVKVDELKRNQPLAEEIRRQLSAVEGIRQIDANPLTGSVLVCYDPSLADAERTELVQTALVALGPAGESLDLAHLEAGLPGASTPPGAGSPSSLARGTVSLFGALNTDLSRVTHGTVDLRLILPLALVILGIRSLARSEQIVFPRWYQYLWYAFSSFTRLNR